MLNQLLPVHDGVFSIQYKDVGVSSHSIHKGSSAPEIWSAQDFPGKISCIMIVELHKAKSTVEVLLSIHQQLHINSS